MAKLEKWTLHTFKDESNKSYQFLTGIVYGHPKADYMRSTLTDGHGIRTSKIVSIDMGKRIVITQSGTVYELGIKDE